MSSHTRICVLFNYKVVQFVVLLIAALFYLYWSSFNGIALLVSHDKFFLDTVCTDILELRSTLVGNAKGSLTHYSGASTALPSVIGACEII